MKLSCAEAIAATLFISGFEDEANEIMGLFNWGLSFMQINEECLELYSECNTTDEITKAEKDYLKSLEEAEVERIKRRDKMMNPSSSSGSEEVEDAQCKEKSESDSEDANNSKNNLDTNIEEEKGILKEGKKDDDSDELEQVQESESKHTLTLKDTVESINKECKKEEST